MNILRNGQLDIIANGYITGKRCGVFAYLSTPSTTDITNVGEWYPISGSFTNATICDFELVATPVIKYVGTKTQHFIIAGQGSGSSNKASATVSIGTKVNGVIQAPGIMTTFLKSINELYTLSASLVVELSRGDEIQLVTASDILNSVLTFHTLTVSIREFFD